METTITKRFWSQVEKTDDCWVWTGTRGRDGYGRFDVEGSKLAAHRVAYELANGPFSMVLCVLHRCDTRPAFAPTICSSDRSVTTLSICTRRAGIPATGWAMVAGRLCGTERRIAGTVTSTRRTTPT